jgi:hypothetical protein
MPDCRLKYKIIVERAKAGKGRFTDTQFKGDNSCLGGLKINNYEFKRLEDVSNQYNRHYTIFENGAECNDVC